MNKTSPAMATAMLLSAIHTPASAVAPYIVATRKGGNVNTYAMLRGRKRTERASRMWSR